DQWICSSFIRSSLSARWPASADAARATERSNREGGHHQGKHQSQSHGPELRTDRRDGRARLPVTPGGECPTHRQQQERSPRGLVEELARDAPDSLQKDPDCPPERDNHVHGHGGIVVQRRRTKAVPSGEREERRTRPWDRAGNGKCHKLVVKHLYGRGRPPGCFSYLLILKAV